MKKSLISFFSAFFLFSVAFFPLFSSAKELEIFFCQARSERFHKLSIQLLVDEKGHLVGRYALGKDPWFNPERVNFSEIMTPPAAFAELVKRVNRFEDTGIDPLEVSSFQNILIDGTDRYDVELWKLFGKDGTVVGWMAYAFGEPLGCY
jgi:hypothetical protein